MSAQPRRVRVGCYVDPITPAWATAANVRLAQALGADDVWIGDHAKSMFPPSAWTRELSPMARFIPSLDAYLDPTVAIARWAGRSGPVMGTAVTDVVRRSAADLARAWMSLHHVTRGKAILGIGSGEHENTMPYGLTLEPRLARLDDAVTAIRAAWASEGAPLTHSGRFHDWHDATFALPHRDRTTPPIWIGAQGPKMCELAGRHGDGWIFILNAGQEAWREAASHVIKGATEVGRDPDALQRSVFFAPLLARDPRSLPEMCRQPMVRAMLLTLPGSAYTAVGATHPLGDAFGGFTELDPADLTADRLAELSAGVTADLVRALVPFGTAADVFRTLQPYLAAGATHLIMYSAMTALTPSLAVAGIREQRLLMNMLKATATQTFDPAR